MNPTKKLWSPGSYVDRVEEEVNCEELCNGVRVSLLFRRQVYCYSKVFHDGLLEVVSGALNVPPYSAVGIRTRSGVANVVEALTTALSNIESSGAFSL